MESWQTLIKREKARVHLLHAAAPWEEGLLCVRSCEPQGEEPNVTLGFGLAGNIKPYRYHTLQQIVRQTLCGTDISAIKLLTTRVTDKRAKVKLRSSHFQANGRTHCHIQSLTVDPINNL